MAKKRSPLTEAERVQKLAELRRDVAERKTSYRARALEIHSHICGSCGREFSGKRLKELTVHHKDHDHHNNPPDGSNWELLCLYCHDHEHEKLLDAQYIDAGASSTKSDKPGLANPFDGLDALITPEQDND